MTGNVRTELSILFSKPLRTLPGPTSTNVVTPCPTSSLAAWVNLTGAVEECCDEAEQAGARRAIRLRVSGAFHSPLVERAAERLRPAIERVNFKEPLAPFVSTVTARLETAQHYRTLLVDQLTAPVKFTQAAGVLLRNGVTVFVEVGPGNVLSGLLKRIDTRVRVMSVNNLRSLNELEQAFEK